MEDGLSVGVLIGIFMFFLELMVFGEIGEEVVFNMVVEVYFMYFVKVLGLLVFRGVIFEFFINFCKIFLFIFLFILIVMWIVFLF